MKIKLKKGDVYEFRWSAEEREKEVYGGALRHCFESLLVVMQGSFYDRDSDEYKDELRLVDTFWGVNRRDTNTVFTLKDAERRGNLTFYCNLDEIEKIKQYEIDEYEDKDLFRLHDQHACSESCVYWYKKIGAKKSPEKKIKAIENRMTERISTIKHNEYGIKMDKEEIEEIKKEGLK